MSDAKETLAVNGGKPVITEDLPGWPAFDPRGVELTATILNSGKVNYWTGDVRLLGKQGGSGDIGSIGMEFERVWARYNDAKYCVSTSNGTSALHTAIAALGIGPGDEVIVPSYTFIASSFAICQAGAIPVFADVKREDHNIDPADIEAKISPQTKALVIVHLYGNICDMDAIMDIVKCHDLLLIEDCAQAHGGTYKGQKVGTFGHAGCFSFCQSKTFTTGGEGGAIITDDEDLCWQMRSFRDHGYDVRERLRLLEMEAKLPYIHNQVGFNYRMTEMQSAIGIVETERMDSWNLKRRQRNGQILIDALKDCPQVQYLPIHNQEDKENGFFVFPIALNLEELTCDKDTFKEALAAEGMPVGPVFWPQSYKEAAYREQKGFGQYNYPFGDPTNADLRTDYANVKCANAAWLEERTFITMCYPTLEERHMQAFAEAVLKVAAAYAR